MLKKNMDSTDSDHKRKSISDEQDIRTVTLEPLVKHMRKGFVSHHKGHDTMWKTLGGTFKTKRKGLIEFRFPELTNHQTVTWVAHVNDENNL
jgi:hypothetical protein